MTTQTVYSDAYISTPVPSYNNGPSPYPVPQHSMNPYPLTQGANLTPFPLTQANLPPTALPTKMKPRRNKVVRDVNAPKRNLSAYLLYQNAMRETFRGQNPAMTFGELAKFTSAMYAELPPDQKHQWQLKAEADKNRFLKELQTYKPAPGFDAKGDAIPEVHDAYNHNGRGKAKIRDTKAPKRNISAYLIYQNAMREEFRRDNPGLTFGQLAKYTSHMYKSLTKAEKKQWDDKAAKDRARYDAEMSNYVPPEGYDARGNLIVSFKARRRGRRALRDPNAPKRARGSFVFFTKEHRPKVISDNPGISFIEMGNMLGEMWRKLSPEEKKKYEDLAAEDKIRFSREKEEYLRAKQQNPL